MGAAIWEKATCRVGCRESPRRHMGVLHGDNEARAGRKQIQRDVKRPSPDITPLLDVKYIATIVAVTRPDPTGRFVWLPGRVWAGSKCGGV